MKLVTQINLMLGLRKFGSTFQIPYITLWPTQGTFYLTVEVLIHHHLWWLRSGKVSRLEFVFEEYYILREEGTALLRGCLYWLQDLC